MTEALFLAGHNKVIVDATNNTAKRRQPWVDRFGKDYFVQFKLIETSKEECIRRAKALDDEAIIPVIERMAMECDAP